MRQVAAGLMLIRPRGIATWKYAHMAGTAYPTEMTGRPCLPLAVLETHLRARRRIHPLGSASDIGQWYLDTRKRAHLGLQECAGKASLVLSIQNVAALVQGSSIQPW